MMFYGTFPKSKSHTHPSPHHRFVSCDLKRTHLVKKYGPDPQSLQIRTSLFDFMDLS